MKKMFKRLISGFIIILTIIFAYLLIFGIPAPPTITTHQVPKIPLSSLLKVKTLLDAADQSPHFSKWSNHSDHMYTWNLTDNYELRMNKLSMESKRFEPIENFPERVFYFTENPKSDGASVLYLKDDDGNETYDLFEFNFEQGKSTPYLKSEGGIYNYAFNNDGSKLIYTERNKESDSTSYFLTETENPTKKRLLFNAKGSWLGFTWFPKRDSILIYKNTGWGGDGNEVYALDLKTRDTTRLFLDTGVPLKTPGVLIGKDEQKLFFRTNQNRNYQNLFVKNLETNKDSLILKDKTWDVNNFTFSNDQSWIAFKVNQDGFHHLYLKNWLNGESIPVPRPGVGSVGHYQFDPDGTQLTYNFQLSTGQNLIYSYDIQNNKNICVTPDVTTTSTSEFPKVITYPTFDTDSLTGKPRRISAILDMPDEKTKEPIPVFIELHGGPTAQVSPTRDILTKSLISKGIAVISPNFRGSTGYGKIFEHLDDGELRPGAIKDIGALLDWIETQPQLDHSRVLVSGGSYGGYLSMMCAATYSNRLVGAINEFGPTDFLNFTSKRLSILEEIDKKEWGDWEDPKMADFLNSISPIYHVDKINIPVFMFHGAMDTRVDVDESQRFFKKMESQNKQVWYLEASNEGHGITQPLNMFYYASALNEFIDTYLLDN